jgi:hypothetical protein
MGIARWPLVRGHGLLLARAEKSLINDDVLNTAAISFQPHVSITLVIVSCQES